MRCPNCGYQNTHLATRCASCGSALPLNPDDTIPQNNTKPGGTAKRAQMDYEAPQPTVSENSGFGDVVRSIRRFVNNTGFRLGSFFRNHQRLLGVGVVLTVVGILAVVWLAISAFDAPAYSKIEAEVAALLPSYEYAGGTYGPDLQIPLSSTTVTKRDATKTPEGMVVSPGVGPAAFGVEVELTYDDGKIRVVRDVATTYVRKDDNWEMVGELSEQGTSFFARAGVDENKVLANMGELLQMASSDKDTSLVELYQNGSYSIVGNTFNESPDRGGATDSIVIRCEQLGTFYTFEGNLTAKFTFESGEWKLRTCEANSQSTTRSYDPLVGTWEGSLSSTQASNGSAKCYGADEHPLSISINSIGDTSGGHASVSGTVTVLAHYHQNLDSDSASHPGDALLERIDFTGTIDTDLDETTHSELNVRCTTSGSPDGTLEFVLSFGTTDDPSAVVARVTSTHTYEETILFFIPHQTTASFTDTYLLSRI